MKQRVISILIVILTMMSVTSVSMQNVEAASLKINILKTNASSTYVNSTIKVSASSSGGIGTKKYKYYYKLFGKTTTIKNYSTSKSVSFKPKKAGTYIIYVSVKDKKKIITKSKKVTVYSLVNGKISLSNYMNKKYVSSSYVKTKSTVKITASSSGGKGTKKYKYYYKFNNKTTVIKNYTSLKSMTFKPSKKGIYTIYVNIKDSQGKTKTISKKLYVYSTALSGMSNYSNKSPKLNSTVKVTLTGKNGMGGYKYKFTNLKGKVLQAYSSKNYFSYKVDKIVGVKYYGYVKDAGGKEKKYLIQSSIEKTELDVEDLSLKVGNVSAIHYVTKANSPRLTYSIQDESICNINRSNNTIMPLNKGTTKVTMSITYNSKSVSRTFNVTVLDDSCIQIGADLSSHNTLTIKELKATGVDYVILRIGYGGDNPQMDVQFKNYVNQCKEEQMNFGVYLYSYVDSIQDAQIEAERIHQFLSYVKEVGASSYFTLPIYYDLEDTKIRKCSNEQIGLYFQEYVNKMKSLGYKENQLGIYANKDWFSNKLTASIFKKYNIWLARYGVSNPGTIHGKQVNMWQTGDEFMINGEKIDLNYMYK